MANQLSPEELYDLEISVKAMMSDRQGPYWNVRDLNHEKAVKEVAEAMELLHPNTNDPMESTVG